MTTAVTTGGSACDCDVINLHKGSLSIWYPPVGQIVNVPNIHSCDSYAIHTCVHT